MKHKKLLCSILAMMMLFTQIPVRAETKPNTSLAPTAKSYVLMETKSGKILLENNKDEQLPPASITKIMTLLLINEAIAAGKINWDDKVTVSDHAAHMGGSQVFMEPGEEQTVRDLVKCISIASANDGAVAMAEYIAGSEEQFVEMMNKKAEQLGMKHTVFKNACGLNCEGHVSTAEDVAIMSRELMKNYPEMSKTLTTWMDSIVHRTRRGESQFGLTNTNKMIKIYNGTTGLKTGYTPEAKHCVSATASRNGMDLIAVILGAADSKTRFREASALLDYGFSNYTVKAGPEIGKVLGTANVKKGDKEVVELTINNTLSFVVPKDNANKELTYTVQYDENITAPVDKGQELGTITYFLDGEKVGTEKLVAAYSVGKAKIKDMLPYMFKRYFNFS
ncbi:MAG: D-alanyl-D-alanine carboxypeptidase family protein [Cellulosilyticaceae bacterium]